MKKTLLSFLAFSFFFLSFSNAAVLEDAIQRGYDNNLTRYNSTYTFRPYDTLRRDEASKFFVQFAQLHNNNNTTYTNQYCSFSDLNLASSDLIDYIISACQYGILNGFNGQAMPSQSLTNAQAITILIRIIDGKQSESNVYHFSDNYYKKAKEIGLDISKFEVKDNPATRGNVITLMYSAQNGTRGKSSNSQVNNILQDLINIMNNN